MSHLFSALAFTFMKLVGTQFSLTILPLLSNLLEITNKDRKMLWVRDKWNMVMHGKGSFKSLVCITELKLLIT